MGQQLMSDNCPAINDWWNEDYCRPYYQAARVSPHCGICRLDCAEPLPKSKLKKGKREMTFRSKQWQRVPIRLRWQRGPMAGAEVGSFNPDHWHTTFRIRKEHTIHIDYVGFGKMGPQRRYREYRVNVNGKEIARGGGYLGFIGAEYGCLRNWPLATIFEEYLLYIGGLLQDWVGSKPGQLESRGKLSVWRVNPNQEYRPR